MNVEAGVPVVGTPESTSPGSLLGRLVGNQVQAAGVLIAVVALFIATGLHSSLFWSINNLKVLAENMSFVALSGVGTAILVITGFVDLSIGSLLGFTAVLTAMLANIVPIPLAFILGVLIGGGVGAINGIIVWNVSTSPIIITLGGLTLLRGVDIVITGGVGIQPKDPSFTSFGNATPLGVPMPVWFFLGAALLGFCFLTFTKTGRHLYAIGGNKDAARAAGIRVRRIVIGAFIVNGLLVGLTGVLEASLYGAPDDTFGNGFELQVITAVIVGGVSFAGGEGGIVRAVLGCALLQVIAGAVVSFNIDPNWADIITGAILIVAVSTDQIVHRQRERHQRSSAMREMAQLEEERRRSGAASALAGPAGPGGGT
jgi:ribose/xylose/arabinose/galactoside ABC-type transport system permease subunit